ncbi:MAG: HlyC/CorC family transporter [Angelakisella sp.]|jgi:putative hemolysin|nr:HlyC/CorC family transporter [Angelakisella sp.]
MAALVAFSAFFSASETSFTSVNMIRIRNMAEEGDQKAVTAVKLVENYDRMLSTILIGNNLVNIALSSLTTVIATKLFGDAGVALATGVTTLVILTFGEILPKSWAKENSERLVLLFAEPLRLCSLLLWPLSTFFIWLKGAFRRGGEEEKAPSFTEKELMYMASVGQEEGVLEEQEKDLVQSALEFDETTVQEVLTPRVNLVALDIEEEQPEILRVVNGKKFSRIPVYEGTIDNIVGVVQSREILKKVIQGRPVRLKNLMTKATFVHRTMKISRLLAQFQRQKTHIAVVIDDYGGTLGIVTMEDLLEELVGEIWDEDEEIITELAPLGEDSWEVSGDMNIEEFFDAINYAPRGFESDFNTMNGWALEMLEHIPQAGEQFSYGRLTVTVKEMDDQRVTKLLAELAPLPEEG